MSNESLITEAKIETACRAAFENSHENTRWDEWVHKEPHHAEQLRSSMRAAIVALRMVNQG